MRIVLDANVVIAAFASRGLCDSILEYCLANHEIILSDHLLGEIRKNLRRKIKLPAPTISRIISFLRDNSTIFHPVLLSPDLCRDPDDIKVLGLSSAAKADYIVTGDKDLLILGKFAGIPIITPRAFSDLVHRR